MKWDYLPPTEFAPWGNKSCFSAFHLATNLWQRYHASQASSCNQQASNTLNTSSHCLPASPSLHNIFPHRYCASRPQTTGWQELQTLRLSLHTHSLALARLYLGTAQELWTNSGLGNPGGYIQSAATTFPVKSESKHWERNLFQSIFLFWVLFLTTRAPVHVLLTQISFLLCYR